MDVFIKLSECTLASDSYVSLHVNACMKAKMMGLEKWLSVEEH